MRSRSSPSQRILQKKLCFSRRWRGGGAGGCNARGSGSGGGAAEKARGRTKVVQRRSPFSRSMAGCGFSTSSQLWLVPCDSPPPPLYPFFRMTRTHPGRTSSMAAALVVAVVVPSVASKTRARESLVVPLPKMVPVLLPHLRRCLPYRWCVIAGAGDGCCVGVWRPGRSSDGCSTGKDSHHRRNRQQTQAQ